MNSEAIQSRENRIIVMARTLEVAVLSSTEHVSASAFIHVDEEPDFGDAVAER